MTFLRRWLPVILWSGVIFLFSSWETPPSPQDTLLNFLLKKTAHLFEYAILYYLLFRAINHEVCETPTENVKFRKLHAHYLYPLVFTILYAISDEIHQSFVSGRHGRAADVLIDAAAALIVMFFFLRSNRKNS